jgi:signal transduction histidine kinase
MNVAAQVNGRLAQYAVGRHLTHRAARRRLTLVYGGLFLLSGAALMAITYALLVNAGFVFSLQSTTAAPPKSTPARFPRPSSPTHPSAQTMTYWRGITACMREHGVSTFPEPTTSFPRIFRATGGAPRFANVSDRDGAILAFPTTLDTQSAAFTRASAACGLARADSALAGVVTERRSSAREELLLQAGIALAGMSLLSLLLGWLMAGRVLRPLEDSYEAQRQFVANASHELRAPLTRQRALIEVALADPRADAESLRAAHERVLAAEQHLEQLIAGLLTLTRGQAGLERREQLDLRTLASEAMLARESQIAELDLEVRATLAGAPTAGDARLLERLIVNLIDNAIRHNVAGGRVEIATGIGERRAFVSVANTGPVVPPEQVERLFQPFQRLAVRTRHDGGHGLGLSIVQAIANAHDAEVTADARPDGGLSIEVSFPAVAGGGVRVTFAHAWARRVRSSDAAAGGS